MHVSKIRLTNFRNYRETTVSLGPGRVILIGQNAQGKTNFLEAVELLSTGKSYRAGEDAELFAWGQDYLRIELWFTGCRGEESLALTLRRQRGRIEKQVKVNEVSHSSARALIGKLVTVSFKSSDLNLVRGGPKFRRDWIDSVIVRLKPTFQDTLSSFQKVVAQRNRLLKNLYEKGKIGVSDQEELRVWDSQLAQLGSQIIKQRLLCLGELLPIACASQTHLSGQTEVLGVDYMFRQPDNQDDPVEPVEGGIQISDGKLAEFDEKAMACHLMQLMKGRRGEEIGRRQSLIGPHRDDIVFSLNKASALSFASQGQQRSLVLALKLAELELVASSREEPPVLLLDDVLAELDGMRQGLLMSAVKPDMQTIITTTSVSGFEPNWLERAVILNVAAGSVQPRMNELPVS